MGENREVGQLFKIIELTMVEHYIPSRSVWTSQTFAFHRAMSRFPRRCRVPSDTTWWLLLTWRACPSAVHSYSHGIHGQNPSGATSTLWEFWLHASQIDSRCRIRGGAGKKEEKDIHCLSTKINITHQTHFWTMPENIVWHNITQMW